MSAQWIDEEEDPVITVGAGITFSLIGIILGMVLGAWLGNTPDMNDIYPGIKDEIHERRAECLALPGSIDCEWSPSERDFIPIRND